MELKKLLRLLNYFIKFKIYYRISPKMNFNIKNKNPKMNFNILL